MAAHKSKPRTPRRKYPDEIPPLEWATAGFGLALLIALATLLLHNAIAGPKGPPRVELSVREIRPQDGGYLVLFDARNRGGTTASALAIEGQLRSGTGAAIETGEVEIDHLPAGSARSGGLFFERDPRASKLQLRSKSYQDP